VTYALGIFNGVADGGSVDGDINDNKEWGGRIHAWPFKHAVSRFLPGLGLGISASVGQNQSTASSTGLGQIRSPGQQTIFSYLSDGQAAGTVVAAGRRVRWSPHGSFYVARLGVHAEYVESSQEIRLGASALEHESRAWQVTGSFLLTRDTYTARGVSPSRPFDSGAGAWGAVALDGRVSRLNVESSAFPVFANPASSISDAESWAAGVSWFLSRNVKLVFDYEETKYEGGAAAGGDRETERVLFTRTQFSF
jgi:phosphate-selective porin OprO/OprP